MTKVGLDFGKTIALIEEDKPFDNAFEIIKMIVNKYTKKRGLVAGSFLFFYGSIRFVIENFRQPDSHLGFIFSDFLTMGQLLCIPMILIGLIFIVTFKNKNEIIS